jgi:uncharacterized protein YoxC
MAENTFYTVISVAIVAVCLLWLMVFYYVIKIFKRLKHMAHLAENELKKIVKDVEYYRQDFKATEQQVKVLAKATARTAKKFIQ